MRTIKIKKQQPTKSHQEEVEHLPCYETHQPVNNREKGYQYDRSQQRHIHYHLSGQYGNQLSFELRKKKNNTDVTNHPFRSPRCTKKSKKKGISPTFLLNGRPQNKRIFGRRRSCP
ncbi:hypothetical protein CEXT_533791 [Caerostris extrusa]|uniref:Uncharacterized protein n=1 Tax=Caerostris extrusa TaxID=172846 RepID=A0AAV4P3U7_CAEEX|nr:hypothetical protein CEXT_533791 [Caerostris extrusa]